MGTNLEDLLHSTSDVVMLSSDDVGVHDTGGGIQGVHGGVDTQLSDGTGQHGGGVQVSEGGGGGGICQVVSGDIDGLEDITGYVGSRFKTVRCPMHNHYSSRHLQGNTLSLRLLKLCNIK